MNCEHVEERLSAYLDGVLSPEDAREVSLHLQTCSRCMKSLAELRQNDVLVARLPRITPSPSLRARFFALPEVQDLMRTQEDVRSQLAEEWTRPLGPRQLSGRHAISRPHLVSLPGGRGSFPATSDVPATPTTTISQPAPPASPAPRHRTKVSRFPVLKLAVAAAFVLALGTAGLLSLIAHQATPTTVHVAGGITPPAAGPTSGPLAAGTRFVFLRAGTLWSTLADPENLRQAERLTPDAVYVAAGWVVRPAQSGHAAGNMLAYIDLLTATIHTIRSDGQQDKALPQPLLAKGVSPSAAWKTATGEHILNSLAWSGDGRLLAFVADTTGKGQTGLYLYSFETGKVSLVTSLFKGSVLHPVWSPDSARLAFEVMHDGRTSVLDYNVQNQGVLDLSNLDASAGSGTTSVLSLDWSPSTSSPAVTWSLGTVGQVSSLWIHYVGTNETTYPQLLSNGSYTQAIYCQEGHNGVGSWLVIASLNGHARDISHIDLLPGAQLLTLSRDRQVSFASWSPDGSSIFYMDIQTHGAGSGYIANLATSTISLIANDIMANPAPAWSQDSRQMAYSTSSRVKIIQVEDGSLVNQLSVQGMAGSLIWSPRTAHQLIVSLQGSFQGTYLVDSTTDHAQKLDPLQASNTIQWTEIP